MSKLIEEQLKNYDTEFGHLGKLWNGKKGFKDGRTVRQFFKSSIERVEEKMIKVLYLGFYTQQINFGEDEVAAKGYATGATKAIIVFHYEGKIHIDRINKVINSLQQKEE